MAKKGGKALLTSNPLTVSVHKEAKSAKRKTAGTKKVTNSFVKSAGGK